MKKNVIQEENSIMAEAIKLKDNKIKELDDIMEFEKMSYEDQISE